MRRRVLRSGMWLSGLMVLVVVVLLAAAVAKPGYVSRPGLTAGVNHGRVEMAWGSGTITRSQFGWAISNPMGMADSIMNPKSAWLPSVVGSGMGKVPGGPGPLLEVTALYVPLWPVLMLFGAMTGGLWWWAGPKVVPGHCGKCGYDLRGLSGEKCPECGRAVPGVLFRMVAGVFAAAGRAMRQARWAGRPVPVRV